jgi:hypothetical protein
MVPLHLKGPLRFGFQWRESIRQSARHPYHQCPGLRFSFYDIKSKSKVKYNWGALMSPPKDHYQKHAFFRSSCAASIFLTENDSPPAGTFHIGILDKSKHGYEEAGEHSKLASDNSLNYRWLHHDNPLRSHGYIWRSHQIMKDWYHNRHKLLDFLVSTTYNRWSSWKV